MSELTILQIGDLHRGKANRVGNAALLDSILTDLKYHIPDVLPIDIVVVCVTSCKESWQGTLPQPNN